MLVLCDLLQVSVLLVATLAPVVDPTHHRTTASPTPPKLSGCFRRLATGRSLVRRLVRKALLCDTLKSCEEACLYEQYFNCHGFNFRFDRLGYEGRCQLTSVPGQMLDMINDFNPDAEVDYWARNQEGNKNCAQGGGGMAVYLPPPQPRPPPFRPELPSGRPQLPPPRPALPPPRPVLPPRRPQLPPPEWSRPPLNSFYNDIGGGHHAYGWGLPDECFLRTKMGFKLERSIVVLSVTVQSLYDCELECANEKKFSCNIFSFRYSLSPAVPGDNCHLGERSYESLDPYTDLLPDRDYDIYEKNNMQPQGCQPKKYTGSECFERVRSGFRIEESMIKYSLNAPTLSECEAACLHIPYFTCRAFSYRYGPAVIGQEGDNCLLTDWPAVELEPGKHFAVEPGCELYNRGSYGHGCEISKYPDRPPPPNTIGPHDETPNRKPPNEIGRYPPSRYPSDSGRYPPGGSRYPPSEGGRYPPDRYPLERYPPERYPPERYPPERYPPPRYPPDSNRFPPDSNRFPPDSNRFPPDSNRYPSDGNRYPTDGNRYPPEGGRYPPSGGRYPPEGSRYPWKGDGYPGGSGGSRYPPEGGARPPLDRDPYPLPPRYPPPPRYPQEGWNQHTNEVHSSYLPPERPHNAYLPSPPRPDYPDRRPPPPPVSHSPPAGPPPPPGGPPPPPAGPPPPHGGPPPQPRPPPFTPSFLDQMCYIKHSTAARLLPSAIRSSLNLPTEQECLLECSRLREESNFRCATFSYREGLCELSDIEQRDLRPGYDYQTDKEFWLFTWDFESGACNRPRPDHRPPPPDHHHQPNDHHHHHNKFDDFDYDERGVESTWSRFTVNGQPCRAGTFCRQNPDVGVWTCPVDNGDWDYCCRSGHHCGYSDRYPYPWCYVGSAEKDQWRPCSDSYYPYSHSSRKLHWPVAYLHKESPPNVTLSQHPSIVDNFLESLKKNQHAKGYPPRSPHDQDVLNMTRVDTKAGRSMSEDSVSAMSRLWSWGQTHYNASATPEDSVASQTRSRTTLQDSEGSSSKQWTIVQTIDPRRAKNSTSRDSTMTSPSRSISSAATTTTLLPLNSTASATSPSKPANDTLES